MPGFIKTAADEVTWKKAKEIISRSTKVNESSFKDSHWAMVNSLYQKIKKGKK
jgi:hypothetical protein